MLSGIRLSRDQRHDTGLHYPIDKQVLKGVKGPERPIINVRSFQRRCNIIWLIYGLYFYGSFVQSLLLKYDEVGLLRCDIGPYVMPPLNFNSVLISIACSSQRIYNINWSY